MHAWELPVSTIDGDLYQAGYVLSGHSIVIECIYSFGEEGMQLVQLLLFLEHVLYIGSIGMCGGLCCYF